jgi:hypothetical protein
LGIYEGWDALKEKLQSIPKVVIPLLLAYQDAFMERKRFEKELTNFLYRNEPMDPLDKLDEIARMEEAIRKAEKSVKTRYRFLSSILYPYP